MTDTSKTTQPKDSPESPAAPPPLDAAVLKIAGVIVIGAIMSILDVTVVSVALPTFAYEFQTSYANVAWTMTGYTLALATVIPLTGWAADRFGTKRLYILALVLFVLGSVLCSFAWDVTSLIVFRVLQGFGGGMLMPLGMTILTRAAGPERIGRLMAVLGVPMLLGPIAGPILGGWLIDAASWHWIFLINVPIGVVALAAAVMILPKDNAEPSESFDFVGMLLLSPGLALFLFGVSSIPETQTVMATRVLGPAIVGLILVVAFVFHALRTQHPLIDLRLFQNRSLTVAVVAMSLFAVAFFGAGLLFPSYFLQVRGETTLAAGLLLAPQGLGAMVSMPIAGQLADRIGPGKIVIVGMVLVSGGMFVFTQLGSTTSYGLLLGALFVMGLGLGASMMPIMTAALQTLNDASVARGSTLMNIVQQAAGSVGTAVMSVVLTNQLQSRELASAAIAAQQNPEVAASLPTGAADTGLAQAADAFGNTFMVALVLIVITLIPAFMLPRRKFDASTDSGTGKPAIALH